ncbi:MAG: hypothetical protein GY757_48275, partial [bacterium]|nr:hypothetical protein [bacterium]
FDTLVEKLAIKRDPSRNPLFDVSFVVQNMDIQKMETKELQFTPCRIENKTTKFDLFLSAVETSSDLNFFTEYCTAIFKEESMRRFNKHYLRVLEQVADNPGITLSRVKLLAPEEERQLLEDFNRTAAGYPLQKTAHQLFEEQVERTPDSICLVGSIQSPSVLLPVTYYLPPTTSIIHLTYSELNKK